MLLEMWLENMKEGNYDKKAKVKITFHLKAKMHKNNEWTCKRNGNK